MCFWEGEPDWYAEVAEESSGPCTRPARCNECYAPIALGELMHEIHMQEHEECERCRESECECCDNDQCCQCEEPDFGETDHYQRCHSCDTFLWCIELSEEAAGCDKSESRPMLHGMREALRESGMYECKRYWQDALTLAPELRGHLACLWWRMFANQFTRERTIRNVRSNVGS